MGRWWAALWSHPLGAGGAAAIAMMVVSYFQTYLATGRWNVGVAVALGVWFGGGTFLFVRFLPRVRTWLRARLWRSAAVAGAYTAAFALIYRTLGLRNLAFGVTLALALNLAVVTFLAMGAVFALRRAWRQGRPRGHGGDA